MRWARQREPSRGSSGRSVNEPVTSPTPEPTLAGIQREFPRWVCWRGISGTVYARRAERRRNSGYDVKGETTAKLRDEIVRADSMTGEELS